MYSTIPYCTVLYCDIPLRPAFSQGTLNNLFLSLLTHSFTHSFFKNSSKASNMKTSNGSLELCYDELNRPYKTPLFCFTNPENILDPKNPVRVSSPANISKSHSQSTFCVQPLNLKIRINPGDVNLKILLSTADTILDLKHAILEQSSHKVSFKRIFSIL